MAIVAVHALSRLCGVASSHETIDQEFQEKSNIEDSVETKESIEAEGKRVLHTERRATLNSTPIYIQVLLLSLKLLNDQVDMTHKFSYFSYFILISFILQIFFPQKIRSRYGLFLLRF